MFVVYRVILKRKVEYERIREFQTLEEANAYLNELEPTEEERYTIVIE